MPFQKGRKKTGGRKKGQCNKFTPITQEAIANAMKGCEQGIIDALDKLKDKPKDYIDAITKLLPYTIPKKSEVEQSGTLNITVNRKVV